MYRRNRRKLSKGMAVLVTTVAMVFIIPAVGLSIDAGMLYAIKARLAAASDAASLAAARSLSVGLTIDEQRANAITTAQRFFQANFPTGYMGTRNSSVTVVVDESVLKVRTVLTTASADAPSYFMKFLGFGDTTVRAAGKASRRDVNVMLVLDRSGSLDTASACGNVRDAAKGFIGQFASGRDRLGLITFGGTYRLDFAPATDYKTRTGSNLVTMLDQLNCTGGTNPAQAFHLAYKQLVAVNEPGALNVILFFTDGQPNALTNNWPVRTVARGYTSYPASPPTSTSRSSCSSTTDKYGWAYTTSTSNYDVTNGLRRPDAPAIPVIENFETSSTYNAADSTNCAYTSNNTNVEYDIAWLPAQTLMPDGTTVPVTGYKTPLETFTDPLGNVRYRVNRRDTLINAATNALDNVATIARNDNRRIVVYSVGLGGVGAAEDTLLRRVANDPDSPIHTTSTPDGLYVYAPDSAALNQAFYRIASEILRLAR
jgi:Flp pilus assembly protein TadG